MEVNRMETYFAVCELEMVYILANMRLKFWISESKTSLVFSVVERLYGRQRFKTI